MSQSKHTIKNLFTSSSLRIASAGRLLSENRTGTNPYVSTYTYTNRGQRATAFRSEKGVASHNGTYSYDDAGRLTNVADTVTSSGLGGAYTWNANSTLASYPGPGYTRKLDYDEEGRLTKISRETTTTTTPVFEYGYGFDGNRRWRKDLAGNTWDWYPCGVAFCAGELVTMRSTNNGASWSASSKGLVGDGQVFLNGYFTLDSLLPNQQSVVSSSSGSYSSSVGDRIGVVRSSNLPADVPAVACEAVNDEASATLAMAVGLAPCQGKGTKPKQELLDDMDTCARSCVKEVKSMKDVPNCIAKCLGRQERDRGLAELFCLYSPASCQNGKPRKCDSNSIMADKQDCCDFDYFKCISTTGPYAWKKCKHNQTLCYIAAGIKR